YNRGDIMNVNTDLLVPMTDANQNFSKVVRMVDENGMAVILKNNKPRYIVVDFEEYNEINKAKLLRQKTIDDTADLLINENLEAFKELAK
ncbi:MAG: type II toxin-antitoxin system Phd/YefM family antitoxin, partial [Thomasclavelia sp.]|nr:type II toxin-antitoxin system Phd/YefM family antitoxin [Thomasclavelia sp.]